MIPRLIARLDVKAPNLVKGIQLEGLRVMGDPAAHAIGYYEAGIDELVYMDIVASLYQRNNLLELVEETARRIFVPLTVGGGVRSQSDAQRLLRAGADKIAINTAAIQRPRLITECAESFGAQCVVVSIEAKRQPDGSYEAYTDNGRERTGKNAITWAKQAVELGAGELLVTSVDREGTKKGFDLELITQIGPHVSVPVIASGGAGRIDDVVNVIHAGADAVAVATLLHYKLETVGSLKAGLAARGIEVRL